VRHVLGRRRSLRQDNCRSESPRNTDLPNPHTAANALSVADGTVTVGFLVASDGSFFSFDRDGVLLGEYPTQRQAMRTIPAEAGITDGRAVKSVK
jgi:hypothetical protein